MLNATDDAWPRVGERSVEIEEQVQVDTPRCALSARRLSGSVLPIYAPAELTRHWDRPIEIERLFAPTRQGRKTSGPYVLGNAPKCTTARHRRAVGETLAV
jgi:hypothetical protein